MNVTELETEVTLASDRYEAALIANDIDVLDALFWHSERVQRFGAMEELTGVAAIRAFRAARPTTGLARTRLSRDILVFAPGTAVVNLIFRREHDGMIGRQSQTWMRLPEGWRIVSAHISFRAAQA